MCCQLGQPVRTAHTEQRAMEWASNHWEIEFRNSVVKPRRIRFTHFLINFRITRVHSVSSPDLHRRHSNDDTEFFTFIEIAGNSEHYFVKLLTPFASRSSASIDAEFFSFGDEKWVEKWMNVNREWQHRARARHANWQVECKRTQQI